ncbi:MAG: hypothetical protein K9L28_03175 [Synergistales bacterium]|nr:hypothetical protein [Synergistales bacterium]
MMSLRKTAVPVLVAGIAALLLVFGSAGTAPAAEEPIVVEAEGYAPVLNGDTTRARDEAKRQAYRDALEKGVGAYVEGITEMKDFQVVKDKVFSQAQGLVTGFEVLEEGERDDGVYYIKGRCTVSVRKLDGVLGPVVIDALGNPRVMVIVKESIDGEEPFLSTAEGEVQRIFQKAGYLMVDPRQARALDKRAYDTAKETGDVARLQELAESFRADVIIYGKAMSSVYANQSISGVRIYGVQSQFQLKAVITQTAYVLATETPAVRTKGTSPGDAAAKGLKQVGGEAAENLVHKVAYALVSGSAGGVPGRTVKVVVEEIGFSQAMKLKSALEETRGVTAVYQRAFREGKLELDVNTEGNAEDLAIRLDGMGLEITGLTAGTIEARWRGGSE